MADTRYYRIAPKLWRHAKINKWDTDTCTLALYLLTSPHRNIAGLYVLPSPYVLSDLPLTERSLRKAWDRLVSEDFIRYDEASETVLVVNALAYDTPENTNQRKGAIKSLREVPSSPLWNDLIDQAEKHFQPFAKDVINLVKQLFPELLDKQLPQHFPEQSPEQLPQPLREQLGEPNADSVSVPVTVTVTDSVAVAQGDDNNAQEHEPIRSEAKPFAPRDVQRLTQAWSRHMGGTLTNTHLGRLALYREATGPPLEVDVITWGMEQCAVSDVRTWRYLETILKNCQERGHTTLPQVLEHERTRKGTTRHGTGKQRNDGGRGAVRGMAGSDWTDASDALAGLGDGRAPGI